MSSRSKRSSRSSAQASASHSESHHSTPKQKSVSFSEKHFIIRFPPDLASKVMAKIAKEDNAAKEEDAARKQAKKEAQKGGASSSKESNIVRRALTPILNLQFISGVEGDGGREGYFQFEGIDYPFILHDLPCIVEAYKTLDMMNYYKVDDIHQFFVVKPTGSTFDTLSTESLSQPSNTTSSSSQQQHKHSYTAKDISEERLYYTQDDLDHFAEKEKFETFEKKLRKYLFDSGLTPPTKNIVKHWQKQEVNITMKDIEDMIQEFSNLIEEEDPNNKVDIEFVTDDESRAHEIEVEQQRQQQQLQQLDEKMNEDLESNAASPAPSIVSNAPHVTYGAQSSSAPSSQPLSTSPIGSASAPVITSQQEDRMEVDSIAKDDEWNDLDEELQSALSDEKQNTAATVSLTTAPSIVVDQPQQTAAEKQNESPNQSNVNNSTVQTSKSPIDNNTSPMAQTISPHDSSSSVTTASANETSPPSTTDASPVSAMSITDELRSTMDTKMRLESELRQCTSQYTSYQQQFIKAPNPKMKKTFQTYLERLEVVIKDKQNQIRVLDEKLKTLQAAINK